MFEREVDPQELRRICQLMQACDPRVHEHAILKAFFKFVEALSRAENALTAARKTPIPASIQSRT